MVAVDVPSGVNASTGEVDGRLRARGRDRHVPRAPRSGCGWIPGKSARRPGGGGADRHPAGAVGGAAAAHGGADPPAVRGALPRARAGSTKFSSGSVLVVGGSTGLTGAVCLACEGAMRAGAGWVRAAVPESLNAIFEVKLTEVMSVPLPDSRRRARARGAADAVLEAAERADAVVLGPGAGARAGVVRAGGRPDRADRAPAADRRRRAQRARRRPGSSGRPGASAPTVLTPHAGELGRLLGRPSAEIAAHRLAGAREAAERSGAVVVLKGDDTLVAQPGRGARRRSAGAAPARSRPPGTGRRAERRDRRRSSRAGSTPFAAACAAVEAHQEAGREAGAGAWARTRWSPAT